MLGHILFLGAAVPALAEVHYLYSGFFDGSTIVGLEFDDTTSSLTLVNNFSAPSASGSKWIALDSRLQNLYVATTGYIQSYSIGSDHSLTYKTNISLSSNCSNGNFVVGSDESPYTVFATPYSPGCATLAISVDENGTLDTVFATADYANSSGVHGTALIDGSGSSDFLYSADDMGNAVWVHEYDTDAKTVREVQYLPAAEGADPRHVTVHPDGSWAYVVYEAASEVAVYQRNSTTGELVFRNETYSLLPEGFTNASLYWADEVVLSRPSTDDTAPKYLLASTRSHTANLTGYVSAFSLDAATGAITKQLFLLPTTASGGSANAVTAAAFSEQYFAITDSNANFVEVWSIQDGGNASTTAAAVAHLGLASGPANAVWYS